MGGFDWTLGVGRIVLTDLKGQKRIVVANIEGIDGETSSQQIMYGALGVVARPLDADANGAAEPVYARTEDGLLPIAYRDPRLNGVVNPKKGEITIPQYDGGFLSLKRNADGDGTDITLYAPKADGSAASVISIDTSDANSNITVMHESGASIQIADGKIMLSNADGDAYIQLDGSGITLNGNVKINGAMVVGTPALGSPVALALPITTWADAVDFWIGEVNSAIQAITGAPTPPAPAPTPIVGAASSSLSASP